MRGEQTHGKMKKKKSTKSHEFIFTLSTECSAACQLLFILWFYINFKYVLRENASLLLCILSLCMCFKMNAHIFTRSTFYLLCYSSIFLHFLLVALPLFFCSILLLEFRSVARLIHVLFLFGFCFITLIRCCASFYGKHVFVAFRLCNFITHLLPNSMHNLGQLRVSLSLCSYDRPRTRIAHVGQNIHTAQLLLSYKCFFCVEFHRIIIVCPDM